MKVTAILEKGIDGSYDADVSEDNLLGTGDKVNILISIS